MAFEIGPEFFGVPSKPKPKQKKEELPPVSFGQPGAPDPFEKEEAELPVGVGTPTKEVTVTGIEPTAGLEAIAARRAALGERQRKALEATTAATVAGVEQESAALESLGREQAALDAEEQQIRQQFQDRIAAETDAIALRQQELEALKPESFWARRDTQDKLLLGISVILGGIGAGLSPAKENATIRALERAIDNDLKLQQQAFSQKVRSLAEKRKGIEDIQGLEARALQENQARKQAALGQFRNLMDRVGLQTRSAQAKAKLEEMKAAIDEEILEQDQAFQLELANRITTKRTVADGEGLGLAAFEAVPADRQAALATIAAAAPAREKTLAKGPGQPLKLNEMGAKAASFLVNNESRVKVAEDIEKSLTPAEYDALLEASRAMTIREATGEIPIVGAVTEAITAVAGRTPKEVFEAAVPGKGGKYYQVLTELANDQARFVSGAAIKDSEQAAEAAKLMPTPGTAFGDRGLAVQRRRNMLRSHRLVSGGRKKLFFEK